MGAERKGIRAIEGGAENSPNKSSGLRERLRHPGQEYPVAAQAVRAALPDAPEPEEDRGE
jgi:hypothetical protein